MCWKEEEERVERKDDVKGEFRGALEWYPGKMILRFSVHMFPPPAPFSGLILQGQIAKRVLSEGRGRLYLLPHLFCFEKPPST